MRVPTSLIATFAAVLVIVGAALAAASAGGPRIGGCQVFPASNAWNRDISREPIDARSDAYLRSMSASGLRLHPDFGSGRQGNYGIPITIASAGQAARKLRFGGYPDESDRVAYPIPAGARVEGGSDRHLLVVQRGRCRLYELYGARRENGRWVASNGAVWNLASNRLRPKGWTSADAAGLPITPGLARPDEASAGAIRHALRFTAARTQRAYVAPARHFASSDRDPSLPPMGLRVRLKAAYGLGGYHGQSLAILRALKTYGMILADNGSNWYISGAADSRWKDQDIEQLKRVPAAAFEVVRSGPLTR